MKQVSQQKDYLLMWMNGIRGFKQGGSEGQYNPLIQIPRQ